jgi:hypothetical protein
VLSAAAQPLTLWLMSFLGGRAIRLLPKLDSSSRSSSVSGAPCTTVAPDVRGPVASDGGEGHETTVLACRSVDTRRTPYAVTVRMHVLTVPTEMHGLRAAWPKTSQREWHSVVRVRGHTIAAVQICEGISTSHERPTGCIHSTHDQLASNPTLKRHQCSGCTACSPSRGAQQCVRTAASGQGWTAT